MPHRLALKAILPRKEEKWELPELTFTGREVAVERGNTAISWPGWVQRASCWGGRHDPVHPRSSSTELLPDLLHGPGEQLKGTTWELFSHRTSSSKRLSFTKRCSRFILVFPLPRCPSHTAPGPSFCQLPLARAPWPLQHFLASMIPESPRILSS